MFQDPILPQYEERKTDEHKTPMASDPEAQALISRHKDAYTVANVTVTVGNVIKAIGILVGAVIVMGSMMEFSPHGGMNTQLMLGLLTALLVGLLFYFVGVLVSAQGQILKASLDSAVNTSPFLTNEQRAKIMSLH